MRLAGGTLAPLSAAVFIAGSWVGAQTPPPPSASPSPGTPPVTFAVEVAYVEVDAIVSDKEGEPVRDLTREDFVVLEDGKPQTIELFTRIDIPYERPEPAAPPAVPPDVRDNLHPFEGRLYVLVLDGLHTSTTRSLLVRAAARRFLQRNFAEGDLAAVVHTSGGDRLGQELTDSRERLLASVDRFMGRRLPSATLSRIDEYRRTQDMRQRGDSVRDPDEMQRAYDARATLDTLDGVADWLTRIRGRRKAVLFFSEGIDYNLYDTINNREASTILESMRKATATATRGNVSFYTIDPRGLGGLSDEMMEIQPVFDEPALGLDPQGLQSDLRMSQDTLRSLADETSGFAAVNTNDFSSAFARVVKDNSAYYVLGYYPAGHPKDGRFHKLQVKVSRPDLKVRARSGYSTPRGRPSRETPAVAGREMPALIREMIGSPLPRSGLPMAVQAAAFQGSGGSAHVMLGLQLAGGSFKFIEQDGKAHETVDVTVAAGRARPQAGDAEERGGGGCAHHLLDGPRSRALPDPRGQSRRELRRRGLGVLRPGRARVREGAARALQPRAHFGHREPGPHDGATGAAEGRAPGSAHHGARVPRRRHPRPARRHLRRGEDAAHARHRHDTHRVRRLRGLPHRGRAFERGPQGGGAGRGHPPHGAGSAQRRRAGRLHAARHRHVAHGQEAAERRARDPRGRAGRLRRALASSGPSSAARSAGAGRDARQREV